MSSPVAGVALVNAIIFGVYGETQRHIADPASLSSHFLAGALAGIAQSPICSPIELAKTRMQLRSSSTQFAGPIDCLRHTYKHEGYRGIFKGLGITLLREAPSFGVYFVVYEALTKTTNDLPVSTTRMLLAGGFAGTASWVISYPLDVVKSRFQAEGNCYNGVIDCLRQSVKAEGYSCLYRGLSSTILRAFPTNAVTFTVVAWTFRLLGPETNETTNDAAKTSTVECMRDTSDAREPLLEKWSGFLASASLRMMVHRLHYSTLSMVSIDELKLGCTVLCQTNDKWVKDEIKCGRKDNEKSRVPREDGEEECGEKKLERTVVKQTVNAVSMALA